MWGKNTYVCCQRSNALSNIVIDSEEQDKLKVDVEKDKTRQRHSGEVRLITDSLGISRQNISRKKVSFNVGKAEEGFCWCCCCLGKCECCYADVQS